MADLSGVWAKLDRACEHLEAFDRTLAEFLDAEPNPYLISHEMEPDGWYRFRWHVQADAPRQRLALIHADALYNLRAALDYVVWQLVLEAGGTPTTQHAFPCVKKSKNWASAVGYRLQGVDPRWIAEIARLQPFDMSHGGQRPEIHMLAIIDEVNNLNKHRLLPATMMLLGIWAPRLHFRPDSPAAEMEMALTPEIEDGAEFFRFRFVPPVDFEVEVDEDPTIRVSFPDGLNHDWTLAQAVAWVRTAIAVFEPAFAR
jgi:hypothetical protein